jgi:hypothetical protein
MLMIRLASTKSADSSSAFGAPQAWRGRAREQVAVDDFICVVEAKDLYGFQFNITDMRAEFEHGFVTRSELSLGRRSSRPYRPGHKAVHGRPKERFENESELQLDTRRKT